MTVPARCVGAALIDLVVPESQARGVRRPVQKVRVMLADKEIGLVDWVVVGRIGQTTRVILHITRDFAD